MKAFVIAGVNLRRLLRDRSNIFFVFIFPMSLILVLGVVFGGRFEPRLGIVDADRGPLAERLVTSLDGGDNLTVVRVDDAADLRRAVERGELQAGLLIPAGYDRSLRAGRDVTLRFLARRDQNAQEVDVAIRSAVAGQAALLRAARVAQRQTAMPFDAGLAIADAAAPRVPRVTVSVTNAGEARFPDTLGRFDLGASSQLLLFVFLTSLTGSVALIETRRLGVSRRMLATPTATRTIVAGEALGRLGVALIQGLIIMVGSALLFDVGWGDPVGAGALLVAFALVGSGAAMLMGAVFGTEQQAGAVGLLLGLGLAALGGSMVPLELFSGTMRAVAHVTPHAWANDGFAELVRHGGHVADILPQLGVLAGYAAVLFLLGTWRLRKSLTSSP
ncbi:MAG TPA: ABC transporter permease [Streptosporangiaceae bacterium]